MKFMKSRIETGANCPVCAKSCNVEELDRLIGLYRCMECSHSFSIIPKEMQERYDESYFMDAHKNWFANPDIRLFSFVYSEMARLIGHRGLSLLDVGCGKGDFLKHVLMTDASAILYGIDLSENVHPGITFIKGDILKMELDKNFDAVASLNTMEHINDPSLCLGKMKNALRPGGILVITTINDGSLAFILARLLNKISISSAYNRFYATHNLQYYTTRSLRKLVIDGGFDIVAQVKHNHPLKALDVPSSSAFMERIYRLAAAVLFGISTVCGAQILQTIICRKRD